MELHSLIKQKITEQEEQLDFSVGEDRKDWMTAKLVDFIQSASSKFIKGQREHGHNIEDRNMIIEMKNETIDLFWYVVTEKDKQDLQLTENYR